MVGRHLLVIAAALTTMSFSAAYGQAAAATVCKDGSTTASTGKGTCSGHGGVDAKATKAAAKAAKAAAKAATKAAKAAEKRSDTKAAATVTCSDGTTSNGGRGACSGHGGISRSGTETPSTATQPSSRRGDDKDPTDALAQCKDGTYSHAANRRGACSRHGGVAKFLKQ